MRGINGKRRGSRISSIFSIVIWVYEKTKWYGWLSNTHRSSDIRNRITRILADIPAPVHSAMALAYFKKIGECYDIEWLATEQTEGRIRYSEMMIGMLSKVAEISQKVFGT